MMADISARLGLPLLIPGQGQKDITHNEALAMLDIVVQPVVQSASQLIPPAASEGECWLVPDGSTGEWAAHAGALACWTSGGWRYASASEGWTAWVVVEAVRFRRHDGRGQRDMIAGSSVALPEGGAIVDAEARVAIAAILDRLRIGGLIEASPD